MCLTAEGDDRTEWEGPTFVENILLEFIVKAGLQETLFMLVQSNPQQKTFRIEKDSQKLSPSQQGSNCS